MKLLFYQWNSFTGIDIKNTFKDMHIDYDMFSFDIYGNREGLIKIVKDRLSKGKYDAVFSINFFSGISEACKDADIPYISWSYDSSLDLWSYELVSYNTNYLFHFDRDDAGTIKKNAPDANIFHLPLAVNVKKFDNIFLSREDKEIASCDVSFVGSLYDSNYADAVSVLSDYDKSYIKALYDVQFATYGANLLTNELLWDFSKKIESPQFVKKLIASDDPNNYSAAALQYQIYQHIANNERTILLELLGRHFSVKLFSNQDNDFLQNVSVYNAVNYETDMPKVFKASKINLNITQRRIFSGIPQRCLDIMGCGGFLLSNYQSELADLLPKDACILYESIEDAYEKATYYLRNDSERKEIAKKGRETMINDFRYEDRLREMFRISGIRLQA